MSVIGSNILAGASGNQGGAYNLTNSLRFRRDASAYLRRTFTTPTDGKKATYSVWLKRGLISAPGIDILGDDGTGYLQFLFDSGNKFNLGVYTGTSTVQEFVTDAVYRDPSAWYHFVIAIDTTQATASNRLKVYVNGVQQSGTTTGALTQNANIQILGTSGIVQIGARSNYFDGYMTEINYVDGQALTPSSFGETSATTGVWQPKKYAGTYGTNGFYLPFTDNSALTSGSNAGLGKDFSGNGNYWNTNNISLTAGSTYDSMTDVPTLTSATASNFATFNPLARRSSSTSGNTVVDGNLKCVANNGSVDTFFYGTVLQETGKWYWEATVDAIGGYVRIGVDSLLSQNDVFTDQVLYLSDGTKTVGGTNTSYGATYTTNDVIGVALDNTAGTVTFYKNNTSQGSISLPTTVARTAFVRSWSSGAGVFNFGQRPFAYTPPTGFVALNTFNLPTPTIDASFRSDGLH